MTQLATHSTHVNTNPLAFEELATSLSSLAGYINDGKGDLDRPIKDFVARFTQALRQPASYSEVTELTGQSMNCSDMRAGRAAWLLQRIERLDVYAVHSQLWHLRSNRFSSPLVHQVSRVLGQSSALSEDDLHNFGGEASLIDVLGLKDGAIWVVQTATSDELVDSAVSHAHRRTDRLYRGPVFNGASLEGDSLATLRRACHLFRQAFPGVEVVPMVLVTHRVLPDFELYAVSLHGSRPSVSLCEKRIRRNSLDFEDELSHDHEILWTLPQRLSNRVFKGVPPCRGGRTLNILGSIASRQCDTDHLLCVKEGDVRRHLAADFGLDVPRDKVRHDLVDRLVGQGFMRKWGSSYFLAVRGMARYQYCLAKYTTCGESDAMQVLDRCIEHRNRIVDHLGTA